MQRYHGRIHSQPQGLYRSTVLVELGRIYTVCHTAGFNDHKITGCHTCKGWVTASRCRLFRHAIMYTMEDPESAPESDNSCPSLLLVRTLHSLSRRTTGWPACLIVIWQLLLRYS